MLHGKIGLVTGVANKRSIAWASAEALYKQGASLIFTYQSERLKKNLDQLIETLPPAREGQSISSVPCDVTDQTQIDQVAAHCRDRSEGLDFLFHSIAYASKEALSGRLLDTSWKDFRESLEISAYSLISLTKATEDLLCKKGSSVVAMTYLGSTRTVPQYNVMGVAKAALEATIRYLAYEMGEKAVRVNGISAGPVRTLASAGIAGFSKMYQSFAQKSFLKKNLEAAEVGDVALFLMSPLARAISGEIIFVDGGYSVLGI